MHGIEFDAKDVMNNPDALQEMMEVTGGLRGVPVVLIGSEIIRGFDKDKMAALLGIEA